MSYLRELFAMFIVASAAYFLSWATDGTSADAVIIALIMWTSIDRDNFYRRSYHGYS